MQTNIIPQNPYNDNKLQLDLYLIHSQINANKDFDDIYYSISRSMVYQYSDYIDSFVKDLNYELDVINEYDFNGDGESSILHIFRLGG